MTDVDINEKWFKALGWERKGMQWIHHGKHMCWTDKKGLPNPCQHYPDFKKWVLEKMEGKGYKMIIGQVTVGGYQHQFIEWKYKKEETAIYKEIIEDNEILRAAVIAATRYWEEKK